MLKKIKLNEDNVKEIIDMVLSEIYSIEKSVEKEVLSRRIFSNIVDNHVINEGLITSYETETTKRILLSLNPRKYNVMISSFENSNPNSMFSIILVFMKGIDDVPTDYFKKLDVLTNNCGWFVSEITCGSHKIKELNDIHVFTGEKQVNVILEPKYDIKVNLNNYPKHLYHITQTKNINRIKKQGLTLRNDSKVTYHPQRIYLLNKRDNWQEIANFFHNITSKDGNNSNEQYVNYNNFSLIEIDIDGFKKYHYDLMYDPNGSKYSYFTTDSIAPSLIKVIDNYEV